MELLVGLVKMAKSLTTCHLEIKSFLSAEGSLSNWPTGTERCQEGNGEKMRSSQGFQGCEALYLAPLSSSMSLSCWSFSHPSSPHYLRMYAVHMQI